MSQDVSHMFYTHWIFTDITMIPLLNIISKTKVDCLKINE